VPVEIVQFPMKLTETDNSCCALWFSLIGCRQPYFIHVMLRSRSRKIL